MNSFVQLPGGGARTLFLGVLLLALCGVGWVPESTAQQSAGGFHTPPLASAWAGDTACASCHEQEAQEYFATPHFRDSSPATAKTILGTFTPGENVLRTPNPNLIFAMIAAPDEQGDTLEGMES